MQNEIKASIPLLKDDGTPVNEGWARYPYWIYERKKIRASRLRIKEWDYYAIISQKHGIALAFTISDLGYIGFSSIQFMDLNHKFYHSVDSLEILPLGSMNLSGNSNYGSNVIDNKKLFLSFERNHKKTKIRFDSQYVKSYLGEEGIKGEIELKELKNHETTCIVSSWKENRRAFYYNQKINCLVVEGEFQIGKEKYKFNDDSDMGVFDWGRGVWTYKNRWYWSSLSTKWQGKPFGWNFGYGFSDRSSATENTIFYDGIIYKLDDVQFLYNPDDYLQPWKILDNEDKVNLEFFPILDRSSKFDFLVVKSIQHQVFGKFKGYVKINQKTINIDNVIGFAEDVFNAW